MGKVSHKERTRKNSVVERTGVFKRMKHQTSTRKSALASLQMFKPVSMICVVSLSFMITRINNISLMALDSLQRI